MDSFHGGYELMKMAEYYSYFRDYDPAIGRYVQSDPTGLRGGINTYGYVEGNPITYSDFDGLRRGGNGKGGPGGSGSISVGLGGQFHGGIKGFSGDCGVAISGGDVCFYCQWCGTVGWGVAYGAGIVVQGSTGRLCSGSQKSLGVFLAGGGGPFGEGNVSLGDDGSPQYGRGLGGAGGGAAGGASACFTRYWCNQDPPECRPSCAK